MAKETKIEWTDATFSPWRGCEKVSPGCKNCYIYYTAPLRMAHQKSSSPRDVLRSKLHILFF
jgi:protein gp37